MSHITHQQGQYVICGGRDQFWIGTDAKTVRGAMRCATNTYQVAVGGKIEIAQVQGEQYVPVAVKWGYDRWQVAT